MRIHKSLPTVDLMPEESGNGERWETRSGLGQGGGRTKVQRGPKTAAGSAPSDNMSHTLNLLGFLFGLCQRP